MKNAACQYAHALDQQGRYIFCRHLRVHASGNLVQTEVCATCAMRHVPCDAPRPIPAQAVPMPGTMEYISTERLIQDTRGLLGHLPPGVAAVAGIPRSGMLPAALLASLLHVPLYALDQRRGLKAIGHGFRLDKARRAAGPLLVVDDSIYTGSSLKLARERAGALKSAVFAALYPRPQTAHLVDLYARLVAEPHLFEWNLFNSSHSQHFALDFDGVLCEDWPGGDEESEQYRDFLRQAPPLWLPRRSPVPLVVTARLEKHRAATLEWLERHRVRVVKLVMGPWATASERGRHSIAEYKGLAYRGSPCRLFVESDERQAQIIWQVASKPVLCPAKGRVFH